MNHDKYNKIFGYRNEGKLKLSKAYDKLVAGVLSGSPGMLIGNTKTVSISADNLDNGKVIVQGLCSQPRKRQGNELSKRFKYNLSCTYIQL